MSGVKKTAHVGLVCDTVLTKVFDYKEWVDKTQKGAQFDFLKTYKIPKKVGALHSSERKCRVPRCTDMLYSTCFTETGLIAQMKKEHPDVKKTKFKEAKCVYTKCRAFGKVLGWGRAGNDKLREHNNTYHAHTTLTRRFTEIDRHFQAKANRKISEAGENRL